MNWHHPWIPDWRGRKAYWEDINWAKLPECDVAIALYRWLTGPDSNGNPGNFENRWFLIFRDGSKTSYVPVLNQTVITSSPGSTQTITSDASWTNNLNSVIAIGGGSTGAIGAGTTTSGGGGGGGAFTQIFNMSFATPGTTQAFVRVGAASLAAGTVGDSWLTQTTPGTTFPVSAQVGLGAKGATPIATTTTATGSAGGALASAYTNPATGANKFSGGTGGAAGASNSAGGAGGGAGGQNNNGGTPGTGPTKGGDGNAAVNQGGIGGAAGNPGGVGGAGLNILGTGVGSGGGGGSANAGPGTGGQGGLYGGGGGGGGRSNGVAGAGRQGVVVLTWMPLMPQACL